MWRRVRTLVFIDLNKEIKMNNEQKHQEDLEAAKGWLAIAKENDNKIAIQILENLFPELRESEDERIRKGLIEYLKELKEQSVEGSHLKRPEHYDAWIAWLEKQGEKPAWNEEDEKLYTSALWHIKNSCGNGGHDSGEYEVYNWLKSIKDRVQPQPKQPVNTVWYNNMDDLIADAMIDEINKSNLFSSDKYNCIYWINSHRNKTIEWSEEDEKMYQSIIDDTVQENQLDGNQIAWLKSIKPNHWKPSQKQLEALWNAISHIPNSEKDIDTITELSALYEELKKL